MQKDPLVALLVGALCVCSLFTVYETLGIRLHMHQLRQLQPVLLQIQNSQAVANGLMNDAVEYGKHNPAINPIIQTALHPASAPAAK
jgi:hypothetical protein